MDEGESEIREETVGHREKRWKRTAPALDEGLRRIRRNVGRRRRRRNGDGGGPGRSQGRGARGKRAMVEVNGLWNTAVIKSRR